MIKERREGCLIIRSRAIKVIVENVGITFYNLEQAVVFEWEKIKRDKQKGW